ncbi:VirB8/TrbF family protein (plasmid) [Pseudoduganella sp. UC29_106]|uniref:VirB8/TrbF family protein n=1 Tax=Pseudoduganella sp. UC29_106 TaxID=3374553 RepID=UPI00375796F0
MFKKIFKKRAIEPGGLIGSTMEQERLKGRMSSTISEIRADRNRWFIVAVAAIAMAAFCANGWHVADKRFAENVRVAYVKLSPNGTTAVEIADDEKPVNFFEANLEARLAEYVERRYSKRKESILTDYGFARLMMQPDLQQDFMERERAADVATALIDCKDCKRIIMHYREQQMVDKDPLPIRVRSSSIRRLCLPRNKPAILKTRLWVAPTRLSRCCGPSAR